MKINLFLLFVLALTVLFSCKNNKIYDNVVVLEDEDLKKDKDLSWALGQWQYVNKNLIRDHYLIITPELVKRYTFEIDGGEFNSDTLSYANYEELENKLSELGYHIDKEKQAIYWVYDWEEKMFLTHLPTEEDYTAGDWRPDVFVYNNVYYRILSITDLTCAVTKPENTKQYKGIIEIPDSVSFEGKQLKVTEIDECSFLKKHDLSLVLLPKSLEKISCGAFYHCENLRINNINCSDIQPLAFFRCSSLTNLSINSNRIGAGAFGLCGTINDLKICKGDKPIEIAPRAFSGTTINYLEIGKNILLTDGADDEYGYKLEIFFLKQLNSEEEEYYNSYFKSIGTKPFSDVKKIVIRDNASIPFDFKYTLVASGYKPSQYEMDDLIQKISYDIESIEEIEVFTSCIFPAFENARLNSIVFHTNIPPAVRGTFSNYNILNTKIRVPKGSLSVFQSADPWKDFNISE